MIKTSFAPNENNKVSETIYKTKIAGLFYIPHKTFPDHRGFYQELGRVPEIEAVTKEKFVIKQFNQSRSNTNVIRGIHAEDWNKFVTVTTGICYCALVDLRKDSPTFGQYETLYLGHSDQKEVLNGSIFISKGVGNSMCVTQGPVDYIYAVDAVWSQRDPSKDKAINLFDKDLNIPWPIKKEEMIISQRDLDIISLKEL